MKLQELFEGLFNIHEAFGLSNALQRRIFKDWNKSKWAELFNNKYRIYLPIETNAKIVKDEDGYNYFALELPSINIRIGGKTEIIDGKKTKTGGKILTKPYDLSLYFFQIEEFLHSKGYQIVDYIGGYATKDGKNNKSIGSLLASEPLLKQFFDNDPVRSSAKKSNQIVVISRHPVDIAGMSTEKGWTSCMNLHDGVNKEYIPLDIKEGTIIAYLTNENDKYIKNPSARVLIKPFYNNDNPNEVLLGISTKIYGEAIPEFANTVNSWVDEVNPKISGIFALSKKLYNDYDEQKYIIDGKNVTHAKYIKSTVKNNISEAVEILENSLSYNKFDLNKVDYEDLYDVCQSYNISDYQDLIKYLLVNRDKVSNLYYVCRHILFDIMPEKFENGFFSKNMMSFFINKSLMLLIPEKYITINEWKQYYFANPSDINRLQYNDNFTPSMKKELYSAFIKKFNMKQTSKNVYISPMLKNFELHISDNY